MTDLTLLQESTRAIVHVANKIGTATRNIATVAADGAFDARGLRAMLESNQRVLNGVGDVLDNMEGFTEEDDWVGKIMDAVEFRCETAVPDSEEAG